MPNLVKVLLLTPLVVFLCCWAWYTFVFTVGAVLLSDAESVTDGAETAVGALPIAVALALVTILETVFRTELFDSDPTER